MTFTVHAANDRGNQDGGVSIGLAVSAVIAGLRFSRTENGTRFLLEGMVVWGDHDGRPSRIRAPARESASR